MKSLCTFLLLFAALLTGVSQAGPGCPKLGTLDCNCSNYPAYCITTGNKKFTYFKIGQNLVDFIASKAGINLVVEEGGSIENVKKMRWQNGVKFAIVQSDVLEYYRAEERKGNLDAENLLRPLRVILPLYNEELHIITRTDSDIRNFKDLYNKRIALGKVGGGSAMTGWAIYSLMFGEDIKPDNTYFSGFDSALKAVVEGDVDAWIMVAGQPTSKFANMDPRAKELIRLVEFDANDPTEAKALNGPYFTASIKAKSYPWVDSDVSTLTVKAFLITQVYKREESRSAINRFTQSLCRNFSTLQNKGHPKWKEVQMARVNLPGGWKYSDDVESAFASSSCNSVMQGMTPKEECTLEYKILGLCPD